MWFQYINSNGYKIILARKWIFYDVKSNISNKHLEKKKKETQWRGLNKFGRNLLEFTEGFGESSESKWCDTILDPVCPETPTGNQKIVLLVKC